MAGRWIPGMNLLQQAWDATKLAGAIKHYRSQRALVLRKQNYELTKQFRGKNANLRFKELFEKREYEQIVRLYVPNPIVDKALEFKTVFWKVWDVYWLFLLLRIVFAFVPLSGYLHPDEHFQSVEVIVGDVFNVDTVRTWEFNVTAPVRSMTIPYLLYGIPFWIFKGLNYYVYDLFITPYTITVIPRLVCLMLSFIVDFTVYKTCVLYKHSYNQCLSTLASSYVMLVYSTRTLSNTLEMSMTSLLFYWVIHCMKRTQETVFLQTMVQDAVDKADTIAEKVQINKKRKKIPGHDLKFFLPISILCAIGIFNRPTFAIFASMPLFFWFQRNIAIRNYWTPFQTFNFRILSILPGFLVTSCLLLLTDSLYYGELTISKLWHLTMDWTDWKLTPLNFILYNAVPGNLAQHGSHPWWLHSMVNVPLLFGPLGILSWFTVVSFVSGVISNDWKHKPGLRTPFAMSMFMYIVSLGALSVFPHQEPRFLIPLIVPIVLMNAHKLRIRIMGRKPLLTAWYVFNISAFFFFGYVHQGGVMKTVHRIAYGLEESADHINVVFSNTYSPPTFPLLYSKRRSTIGNYNLRRNQSIRIIDLAGKSLESVKDELLHLGNSSKKRKIVNYIAIPRNVMTDLRHWTGDSLHFYPIYSAFPHFSSEYSPTFYDFFDGNKTPIEVLNYIMDKISDFTLVLYRFDLGHVRSVNVNPESIPS